MSGWRDAEDPNCPSCGEPVSATASYCMHCGTDFEPVDADPSPGDDRGTGALTHDPGSDTTTSLLDWVRSQASSATATEDGSRDSTAAAPYVMRIVTAVFVSIPLLLVVMLVTSPMFDRIAASFSGVTYLFIWLGAIVYLARKPLPSDIIGDAAYVLAGLILAAPMVAYTVYIGEALVGSTDQSGGALFGELIAIEIFLLIPAGVFMLIGYVGNRWARNRLQSMRESG